MIRCFLISILIVGTTLADDLPQLSEKPWVGWFAGHETRGFRFGVQQDGMAALIPLKGRDEPMNSALWIEIHPVIEELRDGKVITKQPVAGQWEAITEASAKASKIAYRGATHGNARFEVYFETKGSTIYGGGRIVDPGELTKSPIQLSLRIRVPSVYRWEKDAEKLEKTAKSDRIELVRTDDKKLKLNAFDPIDAETQNGPGIRSAKIDLEKYRGDKIQLDAGDAAAFEFWNIDSRPLHQGFTLGWKPDPSKDPEGKARFVLVFK